VDTDLTAKGVRVEFIKEGLVFTDVDNAMAKLLLSVMGTFAEFERSLIRERHAEGIPTAAVAITEAAPVLSFTPNVTR
jgi:DNA invertase Pin-like site-specific DNA recombinase